MRFRAIGALLLCLGIISACSNSNPGPGQVWKSENLRNGSVSYFSIFDEKNRSIGQQWNHIFHEAGRIILVREIIGSDSEEILRITMQKSSLQPEAVVISQTRDSEQSISIQGKILNRAYFVENNTGIQPKHKQYYLGRDTFLEHEALIFLMCTYPFEETSRRSARTISTRLGIDNQVSIEYSGKESISIEDKTYDTYKLYFPSMNITSWYLEEEPHMLVQSRQGTNTIKLINWNGI